uniref:Uncharacterized protein n=1 Tax=Aegilops tauschii subsp. strangulata TaxID=200361 RepID=A0A452Y613_AEGTS
MEMCRLMEQVVFSDPYMASKYTCWDSPLLDAEAVREDDGFGTSELLPFM